MDQPPRSPDAADPPDPVAANQHLRELATAELGEVRAVLTETGHDLETTRARCQALVAELEATLEATRIESSGRQGQLDDTLATLASTRDELSRANADADRAAQESVETTQAQRDHIARLKTQIQSPWRLVAKWVLRRGPYAAAARPRSN